MRFTLTSPAFAAGGALPLAYTCDGDDRSPPLAWTGAPAGTQRFALILDDPDAPDPARPKRVWVHWVLFDIPADVTSLAEGSARRGLPAGTQSGRNDSGDAGYGSPCPPIGRHRYVFHLYALDRPVGGRAHLTKAELLRAIDGHVLGVAELTSTYERRR